MKPARYRVLVWDHEAHEFVNFYRYRVGPFKLMETWAVLRELGAHSYEIGRDSPSVWVERLGWEKEYAEKRHPFKQDAQPELF